SQTKRGPQKPARAVVGDRSHPEFPEGNRELVLAAAFRLFHVSGRNKGVEVSLDGTLVHAEAARQFRQSSRLGAVGQGLQNLQAFSQSLGHFSSPTTCSGAVTAG